MEAIRVGVVMGSSSDWETLRHAVEVLTEFGIAHEAKVVSAHRMPDAMFAYAESAAARGLKAIIAGAGGSAHLPGMLAAKTTVPVLGVPVASKHLQGVDSLHSIVQMPRGIPVATFAIGAAGAANAALFAVAMLANEDAPLRARLDRFRARQTQAAQDMVLPASPAPGLTPAEAGPPPGAAVRAARAGSGAGARSKTRTSPPLAGAAPSKVGARVPGAKR
jgi:5-(carboxyamino)imidazole ribonucleotide mutase